MAKKYTWEGRTASGKAVKGVTEGPNEAAVVNLIESQNIKLDKIKVKSGFDLSGDMELPDWMQGAVDPKDIVVFTRTFATMIDAGLPLVQCLDILASQQEHPVFKKSLMRIKESVESGKTFADSLREFPNLFDELYCNMVAAGEVGGILDTILNRLATAMEKAMKLKKQIKGAMVYPIAVLSVAVLVIIFLMVKVIPVFAGLFTSFGNELPAPTRVVMDISYWFQENVLYIFATITAVIVGFKAMRANQKGREISDEVFLHMPIFGDLIRKVAVARFTRTLSTMMSSGVPIMEALEIVAKTAGHETVKKEILRARQAISEGKSLTEPLEEGNVFPSMVTQMINVGESTGAMDAMLAKIADFYDEEVDSAVEAMTSLLEPIIIVFLGGSIGGILIAMYLPIFDIAGNIG